MAYVDPLSPLVQVAGLGGDDELPATNIPLKRLEFDVAIDDKLATSIRKDIEKRNHRPGPWEPSKAIPGLHWFVSRKLSVYQKEKPSPIAPSGSEIIGKEWILKYVWYCPSAVVVFANISENAAELFEKYRDTIESIGAAFAMVFVVDAGQESIVSELKQRKGIARTSLFTIAKGSSPTAISSFVQSLEKAVLGLTRDCYVAKARQVRAKRNDGTPNVIAEAASTFKLACFAELASDPGVLKLLDSAYDSIQLLFDNDLVVPTDLQGWESARTMLDICALKILQHTLVVNEKETRYKFDAHLIAVHRIQQKNHLSMNLAWQAAQFWSYAELCRAAAIPSGLLYLESASLWMSSQSKQMTTTDSPKMDPFSSQADYTEQAFFSAISQLSGHANSKARALALYGDWLAPNDSKSACEAYKGALHSLEPPWPLLERYFARKLSELAEDTDQLAAKLMLFRLGEGDLPQDGKAPEVNMYHALGTWEQATTYLGRVTKFQLQLRGPQLMLDSVSLRTTAGYYTVEKLNAPGIVEFSVPMREVGPLAVVEVIIEHQRFSQKLVPIPTGIWASTPPRHPRIANPLVTEVGTRPPALQISPQLPDVIAPHETFRAKMSLQNDEDCSIRVKMKLLLDESLVNEQVVEIEAHSSLLVAADIDALAKPFVLKALAEYEVDALPVEAQSSCKVELSKPFRVTFDLLPELDKTRWPSPFIASDVNVGIPRRWRLGASILSLSNTHLQRARVVLDSKSKIDKETEWETIHQDLKHNEMVNSYHIFNTYSTSRTVDATAVLEIEWCRSDTTDLVNKMEVPSVQISLPTQEPRVLAILTEDGIDYWIENGTTHTLNFAVSMASSSAFAFQGYKAATIRLLPVSRQCFSYKLVRLTENEAHVRGKRPLPEFRAFDTQYKRALAVLPGERDIILDQGTLLI